MKLLFQQMIIFCVYILQIQENYKFSIMKNVLVTKCRKLILLAYILAQALLLITAYVIGLNLYEHLAIMILSTLTYFWVSLKNPGYILYQTEVKPPSIEIHEPLSSPCSSIPPKNEKMLEEKIQYKDLGIDSVIRKQEQQPTGEIQVPKPIQNEQQASGSNGSDVQAYTLEVKSSEIKVYEQIKISSLIEQKQSKFDKNKDKCDMIKESSILHQNNLLIVKQEANFVPVPSELQKIVRWCKVCKNQQSLRVRHCHECGHCVATFDHHCPWMGNCIAQKNKCIYLIYLIMQTIQLSLLTIDITSILKYSPYKHQALLLWLLLIVLTTISTAVLLFQCYLVTINLSTWEYMRWDRIEYLAIFQRKPIKSLFNRGIKQNISMFFKYSFTSNFNDWRKNLNPLAHSCLDEAGDTERRLK